jgi:hypothetical protein
MRMEPADIKAALRAKRVRQADIARDVGKSRQLVHDVIEGHRYNDEIMRTVARRIGKPVARVFGEAA